MTVDIEDLDAAELLFHYTSLRGEGRAPLLTDASIKTAGRMLRLEPERYAMLLGRLAGWHSLSVFKRRVDTFLRRVDDNRKKLKAEREAGERLKAAATEGRPVVPAIEPVKIAEAFVGLRMPHLVYAGRQWLEWQVNAYHEIEDREVRARLQGFLASAVDDVAGEPLRPDKHQLDKAMDALANLRFRSQRETAPPMWLDPWPEIDPNPKMCISAQNGVLDLAGDILLPPTPRFFTRNGLGFDYRPDAPAPEQWLKFLSEVWPATEPHAVENIAALQEVIGHLLTGETKYQKIFMLVGSARAGKGTIARVLEGLIGSANIVSQSADKLGKEFGLKALLGKQVLIVPDLRLGKKSNIAGITETLLNISGEDSISVGRKHEDDVHVRLNTRAVLLSNMGPILPDQSGALLRRLYPLVFHQDFTGREDWDLTPKLLAELPGILLWALEGLRRLEARRDANGRPTGFILTAEGKVMLKDIARHGSPVQQFLRECCVLEPNASVTKEDLFTAFMRWCEESDLIERHGPEAFAKELKVASAFKVDASKAPRDARGHREPIWRGLVLNAEWADGGY